MTTALTDIFFIFIKTCYLKINIKNSIFIYILILSATAFSQEITEYSYPRDTTYSLKITYNKIKKYYPFIKAVEYDAANGHMIKSIAYDIPERRQLTLDLFSAKIDSDRLRAVVVLVHGGGWSSGNRSLGNRSLMYPLADYLAKKGYIAAAVEYRLSPEAKYPAALNDITNAINWIRKNGPEYHIDTNKIVVLGCSAGAQLASLAAVTYVASQKKKMAQRTIQAVINIDGIMDFSAEEARKYEDDPDGGLTPAGRWFGGNYSQKTALWKEASPVYYVDENCPPILFINSSQPRFHVGRDEAITILDKFSIYSEIHTFDDAPHTFWLFDPWFKKTAHYTEQFLQKVLNKNNNSEMD